MASEELQEETEFDDSRDRVRRLSEQEIIQLFKRYNFRDEIGHPLIHCVDFNELLKMAMECRRAQALISNE
jgi:hypothetical protein